MRLIHTACVVGARPNFIKMAAILNEIRNRPRFRPRLIHTGQHYSPEMSDTFFRELDLPRPDVNLGVGGGTHSAQTAAIMQAIEPELAANRPHLLIVVGDVNSTMAASLVAAKLGIRIAHVEAGLRSFDRRMPEEVNRVVTDAVADDLFVSEPSGVRNLLAEGVPKTKMYLVGNVMIDTLLRFRERSRQSDVLDRLSLPSRGYALVTLHRPSNVDDPEQLGALIRMLGALSKRLPVVFPVHPRTRQRIDAQGIRPEGVLLVPPFGYIDFLRLMADARVVLTDSGGIQEETTILRVPCLTLRENTERPVTIEQGSNRLVGVDPACILAAAQAVLERNGRQAPVPDLWDGNAAVRIADIIEGLF